MAEYNIETRKFNSGDIRTKYNLNGRPTKLGNIKTKYSKACQEIAQAHQNIIEQGELEKITTTFEVND